ncbi:uncharacterized protein LOC120279189 [Dioscorea cayenensis subsp. rotundata]|uniref:Uncharacterized protein LOC120279189 n=1 Tax=Dioscorea cayennensis subsp. rotundata TaxID=55577 RepID=A0AB40CPL9_DIOCR|nr:uncharacterized protein LOC120279189 [Dioscorea cayenensis subsp. rotundata]
MGKEIARADIHGKEVTSYDLLFLLGFKPLLFVDGTHLLGKYDGILLSATAKDGNEGIFHVAFTVVDNETDDNWTWFLATLREALYGEDDYDKVNDSLGKSLKEQCWSVIMKIEYAYTSKEFDDVVVELVALSIDTHDWLLHKSDIDHWCNYLFKVVRWYKMYSNVAESFNAWIKEARHLPVTSMVDTIRRWDVHGLPCKHATVAIMQTDTNVYCYVDEYFTTESYRRAYVEPIYPIPDSDKPSDDARQLKMRPPIAKKRPDRPRRKLDRITSI